MGNSAPPIMRRAQRPLQVAGPIWAQYLHDGVGGMARILGALRCNGQRSFWLWRRSADSRWPASEYAEFRGRPRGWRWDMGQSQPRDSAFSSMPRQAQRFPQWLRLPWECWSWRRSAALRSLLAFISAAK